MGIISCARKFHVDAAHRVYGHGNFQGKCHNSIHGHRYVIEISVIGDVDATGMIVDFGKMKDDIGGWLEKNWDHGCLLYSHDLQAIEALSFIPTQKQFILPYNPTAENLAKYLAEQVIDQFLPMYVKSDFVRVYETPNCYGEWLNPN